MNTHRSLRAIAALSFFALACTSAGVLVGCGSTDVAEEEGTADELSNKPPQYVLLAFDGSYNNDFWAESRKFAKDQDALGVKLRFTYFLNASYYIVRPKNQAYQPPHHAKGASAIGWGDSDADVAKRITQTNAAFEEGHEMGSHTVGHWDGSTWSADDWNSEFNQWDTLFFDTPHPGAPELSFAKEDSVGFRAPQLGHSPGLFTTLKAHNYRYDTSKIAATNYWPEKIGGVWNFPLAQVVIPSTGKKTLSMDYNFYYTQSKGVSKPENKAEYKKQMLETYKAYFDANYNGNRAPVHIGHHFSKWNGGAYWEAMQEFAKYACSKPNVKCSTYKEFADFMDSRTAQQLKDYKARAFTTTGDTDSADGELVGDVPEAHEGDGAPGADADDN